MGDGERSSQVRDEDHDGSRRGARGTNPFLKRGRRAQVAALPVVLSLAVGIAAAAAFLGVMEGVLTRGSGCVDPGMCGAHAPATDFLARWTEDRSLPAEVQWSGLRVLAGVGLALTLVLIGVAGLNVATAIAVRSAPRRSEFALRAALGASPFTLLRRAGGDTVRLITAALVAGAGLGAGAALLLGRSWPLGEPPWRGADGFVWTPLVAAGILLLLALAASLWPILVAWRRDLRRHLGAEERATAGPAEVLVRNGLAITQVAAALTLLVGAGLLVFGFLPAGSGGGGAEGEDAPLLLASLSLPETGATRAAQYSAILERVRSFPGVVDSSVATDGAVLGLGVTDRVTALCVECGIGILPKQQTSGPARIHAVGPGMLEMLDVPVRRGRSITAHDGDEAPSVAVISRAFAVNFFPNGEPLGKEIRLGGIDGEWVRVVGIVDDLTVPGLGSGAVPIPALYLSVLQHPPSRAALVVRLAGEGVDPSAALEAAVDAVPGAELGEPLSLAHLRVRERAPLRWFGGLFAVLAALVAVLATAGLYGLFAYGVRRRRREIGVRMALGADRPEVLRMVLRQGLRLVASGVVVGIIPLSGVARMLQLRFDGVNPWNPWLVLSTALVLLGVALAASFRPAREAAGLEPLVALRDG